MNAGVRKCYKTLFQSINKHWHNGSLCHTAILSPSKQPEWRALHLDCHLAKIQDMKRSINYWGDVDLTFLQGCLQGEHDAIEKMDVDVGLSNDVDTISHIPVPGEEGFNLSYEGGDYEVYEGLVDEIALAAG